MIYHIYLKDSIQKYTTYTYGDIMCDKYVIHPTGIEFFVTKDGEVKETGFVPNENLKLIASKNA